MRWSVEILIAALALGLAWAVGWALWFWATGRVYRLTGERPERLQARCADGWPLAVYLRPAKDRKWAEPVLLCHGLAANHYFFDFERPHSLALYLADAGFDCYTVEWRGTGGSLPPPRGRRRGDYCVDDHIRYDAPALIDLALNRSGAPRAFWLGHSLGGVIGYGAAQSEAGSRLAGLLALGAPTFSGFSLLMRVALRAMSVASWPFGFPQRLLAISFAPLAGWVAVPFTDYVANARNVPGHLQRRAVANVMASIGRKMLIQLRDWVKHDSFRSLDLTVDYREGMRRIAAPALVMAGSKDRLAPPEAAKAQLDQLGSEDKALVVFGRDRGDSEDYGHGDLVFGARAPDEVYPIILRWLESHATPARAVLTEGR